MRRSNCSTLWSWLSGQVRSRHRQIRLANWREILWKLDTISRNDAMPLAEPTVHFEHKLRRFSRGQNFFRERRGAAGNTDNQVGRVDIDDVERPRRIFHPER